MIAMDDRNSPRRMIGTLIFLIVGPILWAVDLTAIYGAQSSLCAFGGLPNPAIAFVVGAISVALTILAIYCLLSPARVFRFLTGSPPPTDQWSFLRDAMRALAALSALAMLYFAAAALFLPGCSPMR